VGARPNVHAVSPPAGLHRRPPLAAAAAAAAALLVAAPAGAVTSAAYGGLTYPERPVAAVPVLPGVHVNTLTGNLVLARGLLAVPGRGVPVEAFLVYNADRRSVSSPFGKGWSFSYNLRYVNDAAGNVRIVWGDGRVDLFLAAGGGAFTSPPGLFATLSTPGAGQFLLRTKHGLEYRFFAASHRKLTAIADRNGNVLALSYDGAGRLQRLTDAAGRHWDFSYDAAGRLTALSDPNLSRSVAFAYDAQHRLVAITDPLGESERFDYGVDDLLTSITDRLGNSAAMTYGAAPGSAGGWLVQSVARAGATTSLAFASGTRTTTVTDPGGQQWKYTYSAASLLTATTDPLGHSAAFIWGTDKNLLALTDRRGTVSTYDYDAHGNLTRLTVPLTAGSSAVTERTYSPACNLPATIKDPRGNTWSFTYDAQCNLLTAADPAALGTSASYLYDAFGQRTRTTDRTGRVTNFTYDTAGNPASAANALGHTWTYEYDGGGRLIRAEDPLGNERAWEYDALDRLVAAADALGHEATYQYDAAGNLLRFTDREGNQTQATWDALGRLAGTTDALGSSDAYAYDAAGNPVSYVDRRGNTWLQAFNARRELVSRTNPIGGAWVFAYDANGNLISHTDAEGQTTTFTYDLADRLVQRDYADGARTAFTYDANGNLLTAVDRVSPGGTIVSSLAFLYDAANRKTRSTDVLLNRFVGKSWDGEGRQLSEVDGIGNPTSYQYDAAGRLFRITAYAGTATYTLDAAGNVLLDQRSNGVSSAYTYDAVGRVASLTIAGPGAPAPALSSAGPLYASFAYTRDRNGDIVGTLRETGEHVAFTRDALRRILTEQGTLGGAYTQSFTFDESGNRLTSTLAKNAFTRVITLGFDAANRATTFSNLVNGSGPTATYTLDANGSRTLAAYSGGSTTTYTYDARNRLTGYDSGGPNTATYAWDALDRLYGRSAGGTTTRYLYGSPLVSELLLFGQTATVPLANVSGTPGNNEGSPFGVSPTPAPGDRAARTTNFRLRYNEHFLSAFRSLRAQQTRRTIISIDNGGTGLNVHAGGNAAFPPFLVTNLIGGVDSRRDLLSDDFFTRDASGTTFAVRPPITDAAPGSTAFGTDLITFDGSGAFDAATRVPLTGARWPWGVGALSVSGAANPPPPVPRFADPSVPSPYSTGLCATNLLWPYVSNAGDFNSGLAVSGTAGDPFGCPGPDDLFGAPSGGLRSSELDVRPTPTPGPSDITPWDVPEEFRERPYRQQSFVQPGAASLLRPAPPGGAGPSGDAFAAQGPVRVAVAGPSWAARLMVLTLGGAGFVRALAPRRRARRRDRGRNTGA
jgi:YD repeat-containing protein